MADSEILREVIVEGLQEKKAQDITILDLRSINNSIADFFIICTGSSDTQIDAISSSVEKMVLEKLQERPHMMEGRTNREWILLDYIDIMVHVFNRDRRSHFALEELWGDAEITHIENLY